MLFVEGTCNASGSSTVIYNVLGLETGTLSGGYDAHGEFTLASPTRPIIALSGAFNIHGDEITRPGRECSPRA